MQIFCKKCKAPLPDGAIYCCACGARQTAAEHKRTKRVNGTGSVYKRGNTYVAEITVGYKKIDGKQTRIVRRKYGIKTRKEAVEIVAAMKQQPEQAVKTIPTIRKLYESFECTGYTKLAKSKQQAYNIAFRRMESVADCRIDYLTINDLQRVIDDNADTYYKARDIKNAFSKCYQIAMAEQIVSVNLSKFVELPELVETEQDAFTAEEIAAIWQAWKDGLRFAGYMLLMIYSGMMPGELIKLTTDKIDLSKKEIYGAGKKTEKRKKSPIILADCIIPVVRVLIADAQPYGKLCKDKTSFYDEYADAIQKIPVRHLPPYSCRHSTATALANLNIAPTDIKEVMRHVKFQTTTKYIHPKTDNLHNAVNAISSV